MVSRPSIKLFFVTTALLCVQHIAQAFCIYNYFDLDERGGFYIEDSNVLIGSFKQASDFQGNYCCHWGNRSCNPSGDRDASIMFNVHFMFKLRTSDYFEIKTCYVHCAAGGALAFYGTSTNYYAVCTNRDGSETRIDFDE